MRNGSSIVCTITVSLLHEPKEAEGLLLVTFRDRPESAPSGSPHLSGTAEESAVVRELEDEVKTTREDLQGTIEELQSSNEEVMSMNEELQSANEELESSKEELQSFNEELSTVNSQLQDKVEELERQQRHPQPAQQHASPDRVPGYGPRDPAVHTCNFTAAEPNRGRRGPSDPRLRPDVHR